jgi:hypothetical protein
VGDTIFLPGEVVGDRESLGVPYRVLERIFGWLPDVTTSRAQKWSEMWISVRRIEWDEHETAT